MFPEGFFFHFSCFSVAMSVPSIESLGTHYGSCRGSDRDSLLSSETFKSVQSESTVFLSGGSETDTLVSDTDTLVNLHS